ncbi:AraC family transcriptional regulator [Paenibacillus sp. J5C_2022]|uniref:helix-turn-helix transcriptional regulator n=1 Tax=Paenibacillus sp. J5C2022 TaxID=2977129 RepID=UPI0021D3A487|nr:AraC family transcriptional regulator [Paenibacillus sp. J5C2022]MCU6709105.1 AraC family transcriptional regulator [Paenibacillus sp. J5C2022]
MRKIKFGSGAFRNLFLSYMAIMIIPIIVFSAISVQRNWTEEQARLYEQHERDAKRIASIVDNKLNDLKWMGENLRNELWLKKMMQGTNVYNQEFDLLKMIELRNDLNTAISSLNILSFGIIVFPEKQLVQSAWGEFSEEEFFSTVAIPEGDMLQAIRSAMQEQHYFRIMPAGAIDVWDSAKHVIPVIQSLEAVNQPRAVLVQFIDSAYLSEYIQRFVSLDAKNIWITHGESFVYRHIQDTEEGSASRRQESVFAVPSQESDWQYNMTYFDSNAIGISTLVGSLTATLISIALGACCAFFLAKLTYRPLGVLLNKLMTAIRYDDTRGGGYSGSEYKFIEKSFERLVRENHTLHETMQDYEHAAKSSLYLRLLKGYFAEDMHMSEIKKLGIPYTDDMYYCVMLVSFNAVHDISDFGKLRKMEMLTMLVIGKVMQRYRLEFELLEVTNADKAIIVSAAAAFGSDSMMERIAFEAASEIEQSSGFLPDVLPGKVERGLIGISKSYYAANESLQYMIFSRGHLHAMQEEKIGNEVAYYYPTDWEVQLINNLKVGNLDTSMHILQEINAENEKRQLSEGRMIKLVSLLMETMLRVLQELNLDTGIYAKQFANRISGSEPEALWSYVYEVGTLICERNQYSNTSSAMEVGGKLLQYVNQNYTHADVSLKKLAEMHGMSVSSVSKIFKEVSGINFYDYLCRLRMEMAKELLREQKRGIDDIAHRVGYENVYSFKRAFTRYEGIKPDEYAQLG